MLRKEYLESQGGWPALRQYYGQFVEEWVKEAVRKYIGTERILNSQDRWFKDIPLKEWDMLAYHLSGAVPGLRSSIHDKMEEVGDFPSLGGMVSIYKEAARQIKEEEERRELSVITKVEGEDYIEVELSLGEARLNLSLDRDGDYTLYASVKESAATRRNWPVSVGNIEEGELDHG